MQVFVNSFLAGCGVRAGLTGVAGAAPKGLALRRALSLGLEHCSFLINVPCIPGLYVEAEGTVQRLGEHENLAHT